MSQYYTISFLHVLAKYYISKVKQTRTHTVTLFALFTGKLQYHPTLMEPTYPAKFALTAPQQRCSKIFLKYDLSVKTASDILLLIDLISKHITPSRLNQEQQGCEWSLDRTENI